MNQAQVLFAGCNRWLLLPCLIVACVFSAPTFAQAPAAKPAAAKPAPVRTLPPVDEGSGDPTWLQFRAGLMEILQRGDKRALANIVDANILNSMEAPRGLATFRKLWDMDGKDERILRELQSSLQLGSAWYEPKKGVRLLCAPYVPIKWPLDQHDPYNNGVVIVKDALVKSAPSQQAETLTRMTHDIVNVRDWEVADRDNQLQQRWVKIRTGGRDGYLPEEHIRSAIEHRACFGKTAAGWRLMEFVIGIEYLGG